MAAYRCGRLPILVAGCLAALAGGCGGGDSPDSTAAAKQAEPDLPPLKEVAADKLPKVAGFVQLDQRKLQVAEPENWSTMPVTRINVASAVYACFLDQPAVLPRIVVKAEDSPLPDQEDVTPANLEAFARRMKEYWNDPTRKGGLIEPVKPMVLGDKAWVRHVRGLRFNRESAEIQALQTVQGGRLYSVELWVPDMDALVKNRDAAYALAAHAKFGAEAAEPPPPITLPMPMPMPMPSAAPSASSGNKTNEPAKKPPKDNAKPNQPAKKPPAKTKS